MNRLLLVASAFGTACTFGPREGQIFVLAVDESTVTPTVDCSENFVDLECLEEIDVDQGPIVGTTTDQSGPSFVVLLLEQRNDSPLLVIDDRVIFGETIEDGFRWQWEGFETTERTVEDPSGFVSTYQESLTDQFTLRFTEAEERDVFDWTWTETFASTESATFTDNLDEVPLVVVPDPFFWPVPVLVYVGDDLFDDGYDPAEVSCEGADCTYSISTGLEISGSGVARRATALSSTDDVDPFEWGNDAGVDGPVFPPVTTPL